MSGYADDEAQRFLNNTPYEGAELVAYAIMRLALAAENIAVHLKYLGNGDAATQMGAIEAFGKHIGEKLDALTDAIGSLDR